jgi:ribosome-binding factor A
MEEQETYRIKKVNGLIQEEVGKIISEEIDLPKDVLVTVISAETSPDIKHAKVFLSVLPKHKSPSTFKQLQNKISQVQKILNKKLVMKFVPQIRFELDTTQDKIQRIEELLEKNRP